MFSNLGNAQQYPLVRVKAAVALARLERVGDEIRAAARRARFDRRGRRRRRRASDCRSGRSRRAHRCRCQSSSSSTAHHLVVLLQRLRLGGRAVSGLGARTLLVGRRRARVRLARFLRRGAARRASA